MSSTIPLSVRIATPSDTKLVVRLCRRAVGPGDYVIRILKEAIADRGLFLAWSEGKVVGITHFEECVDGSGWLSMGRTDPLWRRHGVASSLERQIADHAKRKGIRFLRLWALSENKASIRACTRSGYRPVCEAAHVSCSLRSKHRKKLATHLSRSGLTFPRSWAKPPYVSKMHGYFGYKWHFVKANKELLGRLQREGELYSDLASAFVLTKPEMRFGRPYSSFALLDGKATVTLRKVRSVAGTYGKLSLGGYLPFEPYLLRTARQTGFKRDRWGTHCMVFEKRI